MRRPTVLVLVSALAVSALAALLLAQDDSATLKVEVNLVNILFSVRDKKGGLVGNLSKDDFKVFEDGKEQEVKYFNRETDLPLTIGLLIDVSASQMNLIEIEKNAAYQFFGSVLRKQDLAFLISFGEDSELLQDYTNSPKLLRAGLDGLQVSSGVGGFGPGPVPTISQPRGTVLYDAVYVASADQLKGQVGRKVLVLITDGEDEGSKYKISQAIEAAQKADAIIYGFYYVDRGFYMSRGMVFGGGSDSALRQMSEDTGGHVFHVDRKLTLQDAFTQLQEEMRSQYAIGYTPTNPAKDGTFRKLEIKTTNKDWKVQARKGYYAIKTDNN
ncbi:MAG TPA: VWA domain-containing protein [Bryobacteraceae bacterium]|jgi:VWFA-related protein|nr:VWA domain-containing protein [Bryobacteraceae bacterium]